MNLYTVNINYKDKESNDLDSYTWYFGCKNEDDLRRIMSNNKEILDNNGFILINYSFKHIKVTDNDYIINLNKIK